MAKEKNEILVYAHWNGLDEPVVMGVLTSVTGRGKEVFSFEYTQLGAGLLTCSLTSLRH